MSIRLDINMNIADDVDNYQSTSCEEFGLTSDRHTTQVGYIARGSTGRKLEFRSGFLSLTGQPVQHIASHLTGHNSQLTANRTYHTLGICGTNPQLAEK
jgi:hypothetical protein